MTYDDVGGYRSQEVTDLRSISTENVRITNSGGTVTVIGVLCPERLLPAGFIMHQARHTRLGVCVFMTAGVAPIQTM